MQASESTFRTPWNALKSWADVQTIRQHEDKVILLLTLIIGAVVGLIVVAFILVTENLGSRMYPAGGAAAWRRVVIPVVGALVTGFLLQRYFPNARGSGIPQTKVALFIYGGLIRFRTVLGKFGCSSVSLATGIALGREGPSVQVGAGIASTLGRRLGLSQERVKSLVPIGASAALAAAFNTPIAAVLFTLEEVMGDLHAPVLGSIVLSSATSWMVLHLLLGDEPLFHVPAYQLVHPIEFGFYAVLGVAGGLVSVSFVKLLLCLRKHFLHMPAWTEWLQPTAGGLLVGVLGWFVPDVMGVGYNHVSHALNGQLAVQMMALLVALKLVATAMCYASGNAGGIFGPSLFIGAMMGGAVGGWAHTLLPDYTGSVGAYALVGMGATFAGIIRVPLTSVIMIFEVTRDYAVIVPLMIANLISYFISNRLQKEPIYEALQHQDGVHLPSGARDREKLRLVADGARRSTEVLQATDTVEHTLARVHRELGAWPVADENGLLGMVSMAQLEGAVKKGKQQATLSELVPGLDPQDSPTVETFPHVHADHPLDTAMRRMAQTGLSVLPVVSRANLRELQGTISLQDALAAYGSEKDHEWTGSDSQQQTKSPIALLGGVLAALVALLVLAVFLSYFYRAERGARAQQFVQQGNELMEEGRYPEAVERYRNALSITHSSEDRLALAMALLKAQRFNEAEIYLRELVRSQPNSGPANLGLAEIAVHQGDLQQAVSYYHQAIYGSWPAKARENRFQARVDLVKALGSFAQKKQARAELLSILTEMPDDNTERKQVARLLLDFGLPKESTEVFREVLQKDKQDADAYAGLGDAYLALDSFRAARDAYENAIRWNPEDETSHKQLQLTGQILSLDPTLRGLRAAERYRRSQKLMEATLGGLDQCFASMQGPPPESVTQLADSARKSLMNRAKPRSYSDAADTNIDLAGQLWEAHSKLCGTPSPADTAIGRVMARLTK
jgi:CIC family chloride channel protein